MNIIDRNKIIPKYEDCFFMDKETRIEFLEQNKTAFIGYLNDDTYEDDEAKGKTKLYLIFKNGVIDPSNPIKSTWYSASFRIHRFVDIEINIIDNLPFY
jgi:hypothetical protein